MLTMNFSDMCACFVLLQIIVFIKSDSELLRYQKLLMRFFQNVSKYETPKDSRAFFDEASSDTKWWGSYDFIIVGSGSSGSVLSNRLTEIEQFNVLVLEAGSIENDITDMLIFAGYLQLSDYNWGYKTIPQTTSCLGMNEQRCNYPRGKAVGGSSVINYAMYVRGNEEDYNKWAEAGNTGWSYDEILEYFIKSENSSLIQEDPDFHGHDGPLHVDYVRYMPVTLEKLFEAHEELGREILDYNGKRQVGFSRLQTTSIDGRRCSGAKAFIKPAMQRSNYNLVDRALVTKILITDGKAYGIEFIRDGQRYKAKASKEVILSAGAINSPQLLMLSGIGPKEELKKHNIPLIKDLNVGNNLQDHQLLFGLTFSTNLTDGASNLLTDLKNYLQGCGYFTAGSGTCGVGFIKTHDISHKNPDVEYIVQTSITDELRMFFTAVVGITEENFEANWGPAMGKIGWSLLPILLHPKSVGTLRLNSNDPMDFPLIDINYFSDSEGEDIEQMLLAIKAIFKISETAAMQSIDSKFEGTPLPACMEFEHLSDDYWRCFIKQLTTTVYHPTGTCKMGPASDSTAVVDSYLQVYGISSLRVVDASIMPFSIAGHPNAACYMIGERAADLIKADYLFS